MDAWLDSLRLKSPEINRTLLGPMLERQLRWALFSVIMALLPIGFNWLRLISRTTHHEPSMSDLIGRGELLLVAAGIASAAVGELFGATPERRILKILAGGAAVIVLSVASYYFADVSAGYGSGDPILPLVVCHTSLWIFAFALISSSGCVALSQIPGTDGEPNEVKNE